MAVYRTFTSQVTTYREVGTTATAVASRRSPGLLSGFALKSGLALTALFTILLTLTHIQPYQNDDLRALLNPAADCALPCWNQIEPGETAASEAITRLQANPNVADFHVTEGQISWWWNGEQPALLDDGGRAFHGRIETAMVNGQERVTSIVLDTKALMGNVRLTLGDPDSVTLHTVTGRDAAQRAGIVYMANYHDLSVFTVLDCPMNVNDFWHAPVYISFGKPNLVFQGETFEFSSLPDWFFRDQTQACAAG